jgi:hypothetical protein
MVTMSVNKYTEKGQEAISVAQKLAEERSHTQLEAKSSRLSNAPERELLHDLKCMLR